MTDRYEKIRKALAMGPTPVSWTQDIDGDAAYAMLCCRSAAEVAFITACDPDTIRALLEERDALPDAPEAVLWRCTVCGRIGTVGRCCGEETRERVNIEQLLAENDRLRAEVERLRTDGASAVRWAPGSAYWSEVLKELFGPDARKGIDALEARWRKELERADKLAEALKLVVIVSDFGASVHVGGCVETDAKVFDLPEEIAAYIRKNRTALTSVSLAFSDDEENSDD